MFEAVQNAGSDPCYLLGSIVRRCLFRKLRGSNSTIFKDRFVKRVINREILINFLPGSRIPFRVNYCGEQWQSPFLIVP